jgi:hypothetical protein
MEMFCSEKITELAGAMLKMQAGLEAAVKDAENPFAKSRYATLNSVVAASKEGLLAQGLWLVQYPVAAEPGHLGLVTKIIHAASGQWQGSLMVMPLPKADPQGYGSALTYARRYSLAALVGLVVEDDDGEAACGRNRSAKKRDAVRPKLQAETVPNNPTTEPCTDSTSESIQAQDILKGLPKLEGINYQTVKAADGQTCIIATGHTAAKKEILSGTGFRWNSERKIWWRYADAA